MIKKIQTELVLFTLLLLNAVLSYKLDVGFYDFFYKLNYGSNVHYLISFFVGLTELGDSLWYFIIFISIFLISTLTYKIKLISLEKYFYLRNFSFYSFFCLLFTGIITQLLKHIIGRPRPNHTDFSENFNFNFLTSDSNFHSLPSGHSSTIIIIMLIISGIIPKLRVFFYFCGFLVAISRVVVGAHFVSDVIAGALVAFMTYKIFNEFIKYRFPNLRPTNFKIENDSTLLATMVVFFIIAIFVSVGFNIDIYFSNFFYFGNNQFLLQSHYYTSILFRKILLPVLLVYIFILPIASKIIPIQNIFFKYKFSFKDILFIWLSGAITLLILVNLLLKDLWGRVRPNDIFQFGGQDVFTPWFKLSNNCLSNCSFVSGDSSVGFMLIIFYFITKNNIYCYLALIFGTLLGFTRIIAGGHFLSDVVFSNIVVIFSVGLAYTLFRKIYDK